MLRTHQETAFTWVPWAQFLEKSAVVPAARQQRQLAIIPAELGSKSLTSFPNSWSIHNTLMQKAEESGVQKQVWDLKESLTSRVWSPETTQWKEILQ